MREWDSRHGGRTERESKERDTMIDGAIMWLARNLALRKLPGICKEGPS